MARKGLGLLVALMLLLGMAPAQALEINLEGFPLVTEPVTLSITGVRDANQVEWKDMLFFKVYQEMTGVTLDFQEVPRTGWAERKNLMFAANELPDMIICGGIAPNEIVMYGMESGQLLPINDYIEPYMPNFKALCDEYPTVLQAITAPDGNMYTVPSVATAEVQVVGFKQWINEDWLAQSGMSAPDSPESLLEVLRFFRDNDMNGDGDAANEIPLGVRDVGAVYVTLASSWGLGKQMGYQINIVDDKVDVWLDNDEYRAYLEYMHQLYEEGLLWSDYFKGDLPAWRSNLSNGLYGAFFMPFSDVFLARELDYVGFEPITGPYGDKAWNDNGSTAAVIGAFAVSADTKYPELALHWVDYFYSEEGALLFRFGVEGETYYFNETGLPTFNDSILNDSRGFMTAYGDLSLVPGIGTGAPHWLNDVNNASIATPHCIKVTKSVSQYLPETYYPVPIFDSATNDRLTVIVTDINTYRDESATRFIVGEVGFDQWDTYVQTLQQIGLEELEAAYQAAYDMMKAQ